MQNVVNVAVTGSTYVLIAIGLTMVYGLVRILHVAHAAVYTLGAFVGLVVWKEGAGLWGALIAAALVTGVAGVAIYNVVYRPILDRPPLVGLIGSVAIFIMAQALYEQDIFFGPAKHLFNPTTSLPSFNVGDLRVSSDQFLVLAVTAILITTVLALLRYTRLGLEWRAIAIDGQMANAAGIRVNRSMSLNFFLGSALAGIGGVLVGAFDERVFAAMGAVPAYKAFVIVVMGGLGNVKGAVVAAYVLAAAETFLIARFGYLLPRDAIAFAVLILVLMFFPRGLLGQK